MKIEQKLIYSILFLKGRIGSDIKEISKILKITQKETKIILEKLEKDLDESKSPIIMKWTDDKVRLTVSKEVSKELSEKMDKVINIRLSKSVIETLTIIAYKQPTTKPDIERIRGVSSDYAITKLLESELIEDAGHSDLPGKPILYITTPTFLELFDFRSINELPELPEDFESETKEIHLFNYEE